MDTTTMLVIAGATLLALLSVIFVLNRSWGNFPRQAGQLPPYQEPPRPSAWDQSHWRQPSAASDLAPGGSADQSSQPDAGAPPKPDWLPRPGEKQAPVLITHPMVRQAAENALQRGGPGAQYVLRQGDDLYFTFEAIPDAMQREMAYNMMRRFQAGDDVHLLDMITLVRQLFKG